ncbi:MAG TPA: universal stress protein [Opitutaceae bacterium]|jgi:nucleotide-binding universal stress UspA family protein|nr:universal stress protein [Opitutaceae bacterium]
MKTILVPIDFSDATDAVLDAAATMAQALSARVVLAYVVEPPVVVNEFSTVTEDMLLEEEKTATEQLAQALRHFSDRGIEADSRQLFGPAPREVVDEVRRLRPDLVVLGSHGHSALYDLLVGSVTAHVLRHVSCPVLVIPAGSQAAQAAAQAAASTSAPAR